MSEGARALGVDLDSDSVTRLLVYKQLIERWNKTFNLVSRKDIDRLLARHLLDSLSVLGFLRGSRIMDLGTGAGLPGIVLAIARTDLEFTLLDRSERKIRFLSQVIGELNLTNVELCCENAEVGETQSLFDSITARAVAPVKQVWGLARDRLDIGGRLILLGQVLDPEAASDETVFLGGEAVRVQIQIPGLTQVHGVTIVERC